MNFGKDQDVIDIFGGDLELTLGDSDGKLANHIKTGAKTIEGRKNSDYHQELKKGDLITFKTENELLEGKVKDIRKYKDVEAFFDKEEVKSILPDMKKSEAVEMYKKYNSDESIAYWQEKNKDGFMAIEFEYVGQQ